MIVATDRPHIKTRGQSDRPDDPDPHGPPPWFPDRGMSYSAWYRRERTAGRETRPGPQAHNAGITPAGYDHTFPVRRRIFSRIVGGLLR